MSIYLFNSKSLKIINNLVNIPCCPCLYKLDKKTSRFALMMVDFLHCSLVDPYHFNLDPDIYFIFKKTFYKDLKRGKHLLPQQFWGRNGGKGKKKENKKIYTQHLSFVSLFNIWIGSTTLPLSRRTNVPTFLQLTTLAYSLPNFLPLTLKVKHFSKNKVKMKSKRKPNKWHGKVYIFNRCVKGSYKQKIIFQVAKPLRHFQGCILFCLTPPPQKKIWPNNRLGEKNDLKGIKKGGKLHIFSPNWWKVSIFSPLLT